MNDDRISESDVSDEASDVPQSPGPIPLGDVNPTADSDISGDIEGKESGYTFPGPGA